jgi:hypothetical protein
MKRKAATVQEDGRRECPTHWKEALGELTDRVYRKDGDVAEAIGEAENVIGAVGNADRTRAKTGDR